MPDKVTVGFRDFDGDKQTTSIVVSDASTDVQRQNVADGLQVWSGGANAGYIEQIEREPDTGVSATSPVAQKAVQAIIEMRDTVTGRIYTERLPMPELQKSADVGTNDAWIVVGSGTGSLTVANPLHADYDLYLKQPLEAAWQSPAGNSGELVRVYIEE